MGFKHLPAQAQNEGLMLPQAAGRAVLKAVRWLASHSPGLFQLGLQIQVF